MLCNFVFLLITARKRNLGQGNVYTPMGHSVQSGGRGGEVGFPRSITMTMGSASGGGGRGEGELCIWVRGVGHLHPGGSATEVSGSRGSASRGVGRILPSRDTTGYCRRAGCTHPTAMHNC